MKIRPWYNCWCFGSVMAKGLKKIHCVKNIALMGYNKKQDFIEVYNKCSMTIKLQNMVAHAYVILTLTIANVLLHISLNISKKPFLLNKALLAANVSIF